MKSILTSILAALALSLAAPASAQPYMVFGGAYAEVTTNNTPNTSGSAFSTINLGAGYQFGTHFGVEANYLTISRYEAQAGAVRGEWSASGLGIAAVGRFGVSQSLDLIGRAGVYSLTTTDRQITGGLLTSQTENTSAAPTFGIGLEYRIDESSRVRFMLEQIDGDNELERIRLMNLAIAFSF